MAPNIRMDDRNAWDDTALVDSWEEALAEYKKYHSIQAQGKRLEDVLTEEEFRELKSEHGALMEAREISSGADRTERLHSESASKVQAAHNEAQPQEPTASVQQTQPSEAAEAASQAILGTVQDENLRNLMLSWYYAGYYTALYTGKQKDA